MEAYNRTSSAYDLSLFDTSLRKPQPKVEPKPELEIIEVSNAKRGRPLTIAAVSVMFALIVMMFVYSKAALSEANLNVSLKSQELTEVQLLNDELNAQLRGSVSLENVEEYARNELGMQKAVTAQEKYIEMNTGAMTENADNANGDIFVSVSNWFSDILEYLGI